MVITVQLCCTKTDSYSMTLNSTVVFIKDFKDKCDARIIRVVKKINIKASTKFEPSIPLLMVVL